MPGDCTDRAVGANTVLRARHTWAWREKPAKLSQFLTPTLRNYSASHSCKAQQAWAGPDNRGSCGTGSELLIRIDDFSFFLSFFLLLFLLFISPVKSRFVSKTAFLQEAGACTEAVSFLPSQELWTPEDGQKDSCPSLPAHRALMAGTPAAGASSDLNNPELRAALWDKT